MNDMRVIKNLRYCEITGSNSFIRSEAVTVMGNETSMQHANKKLKVLLVSEGYGQSFFGVAKVVEDLRCRMRDCDAVIKVAALVVGRNDNQIADGAIVELPYWKWTRTMRFHYRQARAFADVVDDFQPDVIHVHGVLVPLQRVAVVCALRRKIPVVISAHGMLQPWLWQQLGSTRFWIKRMYWVVVMRQVLQKANYLHAITQDESQILGEEFPGIPQILIPNAISLEEFSASQSVPDTERYILFLGRLHPVKGVHMLIEAFTALSDTTYKLVIAGPNDSIQYTNQLKESVNRAELEGQVSFVGEVGGMKKQSLLTKAWVVVVPSYTEVMAMVNLEAAASFTPTITTKMTGLNGWAESGGLLIDPDVAQLKQALEQSLSWSLEERLARGRQARQFVTDRYSWDVVGKRWMDAYKKIASGLRP